MTAFSLGGARAAYQIYGVGLEDATHAAKHTFQKPWAMVLVCVLLSTACPVCLGPVAWAKLGWSGRTILLFDDVQLKQLPWTNITHSHPSLLFSQVMFFGMTWCLLIHQMHVWRLSQRQVTSLCLCCT